MEKRDELFKRKMLGSRSVLRSLGWCCNILVGTCVSIFPLSPPQTFEEKHGLVDSATVIMHCSGCRTEITWKSILDDPVGQILCMQCKHLLMLKNRGMLVHCGYAEEEIDWRMYRTSGLTECDDCGKIVYKHPFIDDVLDQGRPWLHLICDGELAKT